MKIFNTLKLIAIAVMLAIPLTSQAKITVQEDEDVYMLTDEKPSVTIDGKVYTMAEFMQKMMAQQTPEGCTPGRLICKLTISSKGEIKDCTVLKGLDEKTNAAAKELLLKSGKWSPAKNGGKPVATAVTIVVLFR